MTNDPMTKLAPPTNDPMANGLELPEGRNAVVEVAKVEDTDNEAPRRETPNNQVCITNAFLTKCVRFRFIAIQALPTPNMVQQHHHRCL